MPDSGAAPAFDPSPRSRVRRHPERAHYDRGTVFAILDSSLLCHIGYVIDGLPYVTPTLFWLTASGSTGMARRPAACCADRPPASRSA
jgi:hypothetical protein